MGNDVAELGKQQRQIAKHVAENGIRCTSMTVTVFGDLLSQHGGWMWMGSLIDALAPFGFNERLVRTAVYRLVQSDWLTANKVGRRSYYCFTETARHHYEKAARRIYQPHQHRWDGKWLLVLPISVPESKRDEFRRSLIWQGFNTLANGVYAHPSSDRKSLDESLIELGLGKDVVVFTASNEDTNSIQTVKELAKERWNVSELQQLYADFLRYFRPWNQVLDSEIPDPQACLNMRLLLIHDFRRILLRDPNFPDAMLPNGWVGHKAYDLLQRLYKRLWGPSVNYIQQNFENAQGLLGAPCESFYDRFGGLTDNARARL